MSEAEDKETKASVASITKNLKGLDTSGVEVDEEQVAPTVDADSPEEAQLLEKLEEALKELGDEKAIAASKDTKLMCLREWPHARTRPFFYPAFPPL